MKVEIVFWDVQHGHASYIKSPNNRNIVIDLGIGSFKNSTQDFSPLLYLKNHFGIEWLDYVVITHPHLDHIDDILNFYELSPIVLTRPNHLTRDDIMKNVRESDRPKYERYLEINSAFNNLIPSYNDPFKPDNYGGLEIKTFLTPDCPTTNLNNHSIVTVISYEGMKVIFPGDNEKCSFDKLMEDQNFVDATRNADILLAPHHGRDSGFHLDFIKNANPRVTIISDGNVCDTSATSRYSSYSRGINVFCKSSMSFVKRKCLTTRADGVISAKMEIYKGSRSISLTIE